MFWDMFLARPPSVDMVRVHIQTMLDSTLLPLSNVRRLALLESCRTAPTVADLVDMSLEALESSSSTSEVKDQILEALVTGDWETVHTLSSAVSRAPCCSVAPTKDSFGTFRRMAITIFYASRKVQQELSSEARRSGASAILSTTSREELLDVFLTVLIEAAGLDEETRAKIAHDVCEGRYYRLVLPDRLDCEPGRGVDDSPHLCPDDEGIRVSDGRHISNNISGHVQVEHVWIDEITSTTSTLENGSTPEESCPICLGAINSETPIVLLQCHHVFCRDCILDWAHESGGGDQANIGSSRTTGHNHDVSVTCPLCRQSNVVPNEQSQYHSHGGRSRIAAHGDAWGHTSSFSFPQQPLPDWNMFHSLRF